MPSKVSAPAKRPSQQSPILLPTQTSRHLGWNPAQLATEIDRYSSRPHFTLPRVPSFATDRFYRPYKSRSLIWSYMVISPKAIWYHIIWVCANSYHIKSNPYDMISNTVICITIRLILLHTLGPFHGSSSRAQVLTACWHSCRS
ncbi:hypothetical protein V1509DRAFT_495439 [Lipomyces kononenkoae]